MLLFNCSNVEREAPMFRKHFYFVGDGVSTDILVNLAKAPVGMNFVGGKYPAAAYLERECGLKVVTHRDGVLLFSFSEAPAKNDLRHATVAFYYD